jgi:mannose-6-phosphate isomerase-like protein (cupin superfamily)
VIDGEMFIAFRDGEVKLSKGEMYVVLKGMEHKPYAEKECHIMLVEPKGVVNTGEVSSELTAESNVWIY